MRETAIEIREHFRPVIGMCPWRAKLGVGSFLTFEFGTKIKAHGFVHGEWHLWIYLANWTLYHRDRLLVDSDADRKVIQVAVRRLEEQSLTSVDFERKRDETTFIFDDFRLRVSPANDLEYKDERDYYWMFFLPRNEVLTHGPAGVRVGPAAVEQHA